MLLAEDMLLLLTHDETGKAVADTTRLDLALAGAVLLELADHKRVGVAEPGGKVKAGRLVVLDESPVGEPVLDEALRRITEKGPRKPQDVLPSVAKALRERLLDRLVDRGILQAEEGRVLWVFPTKSWPAVDVEHERALRAGLRDVLVVSRTPATRDAGLIGLLHAIGQERAVLADPGDAAKALERRAKDIAEGAFAGDAVRKAVEAVDAAVMVAVTAATTTTVVTAATS